MIGYAVVIAFFVGIFSATGMDRGADMITKFIEPLASVLTTALGVSVYLLVSDRSKEVSDVFT
jgi:ABC-type tungstate transport system substrate-binding protein